MSLRLSNFIIQVASGCNSLGYYIDDINPLRRLANHNTSTPPQHRAKGGDKQPPTPQLQRSSEKHQHNSTEKENASGDRRESTLSNNMETELNQSGGGMLVKQPTTYYDTELTPPCTFNPRLQLSVVIIPQNLTTPNVEQDKKDIARLLKSLAVGLMIPHECLVMDIAGSGGASKQKLRDTEEVTEALTFCNKSGMIVKIIEFDREVHGTKSITAGIRNLAAKSASTQSSWLLFLESECLPSINLLPGLVESVEKQSKLTAKLEMPGAVGFAGSIGVANQGLFNGAILDLISPPPIDIPLKKETAKKQKSFAAPAFLTSYCSLIWRPAFDSVGGFDERNFVSDIAEDIDLSMRILAAGAGKWRFAYTLGDSKVMYEFRNRNEGAVVGCWNMFKSYGVGCRRLQQKYGSSCLDFRPSPTFGDGYLIDKALSYFQYLAMKSGFESEETAEDAKHKRRGCSVFTR